MLPEPSLTFTLPSLHDGTVLDCRVYHPASLAAANSKAPPWKRHAAVIAHPYAPLGGCYDDPILEGVAARLLRAGYLVGTFNFRGAGHSAGRTSWTAKPERDDYASVVGFMVHYIHVLDPFPLVFPSRGLEPDDKADTNVDRGLALSTNLASSSSSHVISSKDSYPVLIMGGYSYGAMVTTQLDPLEQVLLPFATPNVDSYAAQIRLRAQHLAEQQNEILGDVRAAILQTRSPQSLSRGTGSVRIGGDEGDRSPRRSHDSTGQRSFSFDTEDIRRGMHDFMAKRKAKYSSHHHHLTWPRQHDPASSIEKDNGDSAQGGALLDNQDTPAGKNVESADEHTSDADKLPPITDLLRPQPAYLLVSPLQGLVTHLTTMSLVPSRLKQQQNDPAETKLVVNPTLAVFGDSDVFVSASKLRTWTTGLAARTGSKFTGFEVGSAGHFWSEEGVLRTMVERVGKFAGELLRG